MARMAIVSSRAVFEHQRYDAAFYLGQENDADIARMEKRVATLKMLLSKAEHKFEEAKRLQVESRKRAKDMIHRGEVKTII